MRSPPLSSGYGLRLRGPLAPSGTEGVRVTGEIALASGRFQGQRVRFADATSDSFELDPSAARLGFDVGLEENEEIWLYFDVVGSDAPPILQLRGAQLVALGRRAPEEMREARADVRELAAEPAQVRAALELAPEEALLQFWWRAARAGGAQEEGVSASQRSRLEALGYIGEEEEE